MLVLLYGDSHGAPQHKAQAIATGRDVGKGEEVLHVYAVLLERAQHMVVERLHIAHMVEVEHQEPCGAHELHAARAQWLHPFVLAVVEVGLVFGRVEHAHVGEGRQLGLGAGVAAAVGEDELLRFAVSYQDIELLCIASLQGLVECVIDVVNHFVKNGLELMFSGS